ncbi:MAG: nucleotidyltransferase domain-containing protein [Candidatus Nanopelagicales bacterium]
MDASIIDCAVEQLRACGAEFAYLHGSRASGSARADSDYDVAAYFDDSPVDRVRWESQTRKVYSDEKYRIDRSHREFLEGAARGR